MKEETLAKVNALLAELAREAGPDGAIAKSPALVATTVGLSSGLETARAMRALLARKRVVGGENGYHLVSAEPITPGEPLAIVPQRKKRSRAAAETAATGPMAGVPTYEDVGRAVVDRLITLGRELSELRAGRGTEERARMDAAERRAAAAELRAKEMQEKLAMAEANLREVLRAASLAKSSGAATPIDDPEAVAVLRFLQSSEAAEVPEGAPGE